MELIWSLIDFILHIDRHLSGIIQNYGTWTYLILFLIIFCETGLVVTPLLPGDSLLFAAGAFAAQGVLDPLLLMVLLSVAAIAGDTVNYWIGYHTGPRIFRKENVRFLNREYLERTHRFYEKHGGKAIVLARFAPILRTFAPFVAGIGRMTYGRFVVYNVIGGVLWIGVFLLGGYFFSSLPVVEQNFTLVVVAIILISLMPSVVGLVRHRRGSS
ncbi:MAG TPA: DedA family protein [Longimicrobiales bacterium]